MTCFYINHLHAPFSTVAIRRPALSVLDQSDMMTAAAGSDASLLCPNTAPGLQTIDPGVHFWIRGNGLAAGVGWCDSPRLEELRNRWLASPDPGEQKRLATEIQLQCWQDVPYYPTGQFFQKTAYRRAVVRAVPDLPVFWGVERRT